MLAVVFRYLPAWLKWGALGVVFVAVAGLYMAHRNAIYQDGFRTAEEQCERERRAQEEANNAAIRKAEKDLFEAADRLSMKSKELSDALKAIDEASAADPDGALCGLNARGVSRLQAIGNGASASP